MSPEDAIDMTREAIMLMLMVSAPMLVAGLAIGLLVGLLQAATQIQEQSVSFVPKIIVMVLALSLSLPWLISQMVTYSHDLISNIPHHL